MIIMDYSKYKSLKAKVEDKAEKFTASANEAADAAFQNAKNFGDKASAKLDEVPSEVQSRVHAEIDRVEQKMKDGSNFKYIAIAGVVVIVVAVVAGMFL